jgi:membrane protein YqaA with SNARE-associated domain
MNWLAESGLAAAIGVASALLPIVNAEAYALLAAARTHGVVAMAVVLALATGQTIGKLVLFQAARRGSGRLHTRLCRRGGGRTARWHDRVCGLMTRRRTGLPTVMASAAVGLPPLALVSLVAGASAQRRWEFGTVCLVGRTARFAALTLPAVYALS